MTEEEIVETNAHQIAVAAASAAFVVVTAVAAGIAAKYYVEKKYASAMKRKFEILTSESKSN